MFRKISLILLVILLVSVGCRSVTRSARQKTKHLDYNIDCSDCGVSKDDALEIGLKASLIDSNAMVGEKRLFLKFRNNTKDILLLNDKLFVLTDEGSVAANPIGYYHYNHETKLYPDLYRGFFNMKMEVPWNEKSNHVVLPPEASTEYEIINYFDYIISIMLDENYKIKASPRREYYSFNWEEIESDLELFGNNEIKITIVYKKLNDENWQHYTITPKMRPAGDENYFSER